MKQSFEGVKAILWHLIVALTAAYILSTVYLYFNQANMLYLPGLPSRSVSDTPHSIGLNYERVQLQASDGINLDAWFVPVDGARGTLLFCHGNAGNISHRLQSIKIFHQLGYSVLIYDYRGYGNSEGKPSESGTYLDAEAAWHYLTDTRQIMPSDIIIFGRSLGGAVASDLAAKTTPRALIIESTFTSVPDLAAQLYGFFPVRSLSRFSYPTEENIQKVKAPVLIVHSLGDEIIPYSHGQRLFDVAAEPKQFLRINGGHNEGPWVSGRIYLEGISDFLKSL